MSALLLQEGNLLVTSVLAIFEIVVILSLVFRFLNKFIKRLDRIEYALYNDGKTGLINKVDELLDNQQSILVDVEVLKSKLD